MKKRQLSTREQIMVAVLVLALLGAIYYLAFYQPLQRELQSIDSQCMEIDSEIEIASAKLASMNGMQAELDEIFANAQKEDVSQIAPFDNAKVIMNQLDGILSNACSEYNLAFQDPVIDEESGVVRRTVTIQFTSPNYASAKQIATSIANSQFRCLVTSFLLESETDLMNESVNVTASIVYIESTKLA